MTFALPAALGLLAVVPLAVVAYVLLDRSRRRSAGRFASAALLPNLIAASPGRRRHVPLAFALAALALLIVGMARPHVTRTLTRDTATIVVAVDTSRSMSADDVAPTRLVAAQKAIETLIDEAPAGYELGIVSFATSAEPVLLPTLDRDAARTAVRELRLGSGTAIGQAIARSLELAEAGSGDLPPTGAKPPAAIVLLSDGAQTTGGITPDQAAKRAREAGIPVSTIALGTRDAVVEVPLANGLVERVAVPPDVPTLRRIASTTGGTFSEALDAGRLERVFGDLGTRLAHERRSVEVTSAFAGGGAVLLLVGGALASLWFRRAL